METTGVSGLGTKKESLLSRFLFSVLLEIIPSFTAGRIPQFVVIVILHPVYLVLTSINYRSPLSILLVLYLKLSIHVTDQAKKQIPATIYSPPFSAPDIQPRKKKQASGCLPVFYHLLYHLPLKKKSGLSGPGVGGETACWDSTYRLVQPIEHVL